MEKLPRIYCLSIPGSERMKHMRERLDRLGLQYEFVHGKVFDPVEVPFNAIKDASRLKQNWQEDDKIYRYLCNMYGCKEGHIRLLLKALDDGVPYIISCEDDIQFQDGFVDFLKETLPDLDEKLRGMLYINGSNMNINDFHDEKYAYLWCWPGDSAYLLNRAGAKLYLEGLLAGHKESDSGMTDYLKKLRFTLPAANPSLNTVRFSNDYLKSNIVCR